MIPSQLPIFVTVVKAGSFSAAARSLGISAAAVSKAISTLERHLQVRLFHRTTHSLTLTDEGHNLHRRIAPLLQELEDQIRISTDTRDTMRGRLKINLPNSFGVTRVYPRLLEFMQRYPEVELDLHFDDRVQDLVENGFDLGIGNRVDEDSRLIARPYHQIDLVCICAPDYAERHGIPERVEELARHNCVAYRSPSTGRRLPWPFVVEGKQVQHLPTGTLTVTNPATVLDGVRAGLGIGMVSRFQGEEALARGEVVEILADFRAEPITVWLYYSSRSYLPTRTRRLIDFLLEDQTHSTGSAMR